MIHLADERIEKVDLGHLRFEDYQDQFATDSRLA
jgi:hypothetical protein